MLPYQNSNLTVPARVAELLSRMTLEEKAAQLDMTRGVEFTTKPSARHNCSVEPGDFRILIGASSRDIRLKKNITLRPEK